MKQSLLSLALLLGGAALAQTAAPAQPAKPPAAQPAPQTRPAPQAQPPRGQQVAPAQPAQDPNTVVARVGSENITLGDFEKQYRVYVGRLVNSQSVPFTDDVLPYFNEYRPEILRQVARQRGIVQLANAAGVKPDPAKVDAAVAESRKGFENDAAFQGALAQSGYGNEANYRAMLAENLQVTDYLNSLKSKFKFPDAVVAGYYQTHKGDYQREAQACVKHILLKDDAAAAAARARLDKGEDFAKVAQDVSQDPGSKDQGGDLGCFGQGVTVPEFDKAAFSGPLNQLQQVKTQFGTHLLIVTKRTPGGLAPLSEVQADIRSKLADDAAQKYVDSQLARLGTQTFADKVTLPTPQQK